MIYKEIIFMKNQWKKYLIDFLLISIVDAYYICQNKDFTMLFFLSIALMGIVTILQIIYSSVMLEKKNGTFEKLLSVYSVQRILLAKIIVGFGVGFFVSTLCSMGIGIFLFNQELIQTSMSLLVSVYLITVCMEWTLCIILVMLFVFVDRMIIINICVMGIIMIMAMLSSNIPMDNSIIVYDLVCGGIILIVGFVILYLMRYISSKVLLRTE